MSKRKQPPMLTVRVNQQLDVADLVCDNEPDALYEAIVAIDESVQDWGFTIRLADYFDKQRAIWEKEVAKDHSEEGA
jgi:hypothetical protein